METTIQKWGNSLGVRIPSAFAKELKLENALQVIIKIDNKKLVISPKKDDLVLKSLLDKVNKNNVHQEVGTGKKYGKEAW